MRYRVFDLECSIITSFKRKSNPLDQRNNIIVVASKSGESHDVDIAYNPQGIRRDFDFRWSDFDLLVGQNIKYDLLYIWSNPAFQAWLKAGGKIWDTMVAEYLITGQQSTYASLDDLARKYGGEIKDDEVKAHWDAGIDTSKIDPDILLPYARMDILNTEKAFLAQLNEARRLGMLPLVEGYMDHLLALTEMEFNGLYVDLETARKKQGELETRIGELEAIMADQMKDILPNFNPNSPDQVSAILFGTELPCKRVIEKVDADGNVMVYGPKAAKAGQVMTHIEHLRAPLPNGFKLQVSGLTPMKGGKTYKVDADILLKVRNGLGRGYERIVSFIDAYLEYKELQKLLTTYIYGRKEIVHSVRYDDPTRGRGYSFRKEIEVKESGLIPLVYPIDGCVHHKLDMVQTVTGRLNSRDPNMQNIPTDLRNLFTSRYGKEGVIISFDYCLTPETKVLTEEFIWKPIKDIEIGETLIGFPEHIRIHDNANFRPSVVEGKKTLIKDCVEIVTSEGNLRCSKDHMWKVSNRVLNPLRWKKAEELKVGWHLSKVMEVWDTPNNAETNWMGGFLDGEGYLSNNSQIGVGQNADGDNGLCLEKALMCFEKYMVNCENRFDRKRRCVKVRPAGMRTGWQAVGVFQPVRLKAKLKRTYGLTSIRGNKNRKVKILEINDIGPQKVVAIQTSTKTFLAEGFLSHNCQLEVCVQAYLAQSDRMINDIKNGVDFHLKRLAYAEGLTYEEMCERYNNDKATWTPKRRAAKVVSFQKAYGAHPDKIAKETGLSVETIEKIFAAEAADYPEVNDFMGVVEDAARRTRIPTPSLLELKDKDTGVRGITRPGLSRGLGFYQSITGKRYGFLEYGTTSAKLRERGTDPFVYFKSTEITNYPVQGTAADIVALCVGRVFRRLQGEEQIHLVNEVHDELVVDCKAEIAETTVERIQSILEDVNGAFKEILGVEFNCPIKVEYHIGTSWSKEED